MPRTHHAARVAERLEAVGIDGVCDRLSGGTTMTAIAEELDVGVATLIAWLGTPERSARANEARRLAAQVWDEKAEQVLLNATNQSVPRARELAQHYRWRASKMAPRTYGDRLEHSGPAADGAHIVRVITGVPPPDDIGKQL